jgi:hypothetical protein
MSRPSTITPGNDASATIRRNRSLIFSRTLSVFATPATAAVVSGVRMADVTSVSPTAIVRTSGSSEIRGSKVAKPASTATGSVV